MRAEIITDRHKWNAFIASSKYCNITQTYEWGELLAEDKRCMLPIGVIDDTGELCAAMLVLVKRINMLKLTYFYVPRGPVIDEPNAPALDVLLECVRCEAKKRAAFMLKVEPGVLDGDEQWLSALSKRAFCPNVEAHHLRREWVLDLRSSEEEILAGMKRNWRYNIRLAGRKQIAIREGQGPADFAIFYHLLSVTAERDGFAIYGRDFYERFLQLYEGRTKLFIAEYEEQPLAVALLVVHGRWCWYIYGASSNEHRDYKPTYLLQWTSMCWAKEQGCWYYNFRGIPDKLEPSQPLWGVYEFKSGFGGYSMRALETHDLPYKPAVYQLYRSLLKVRMWYWEQKQKKGPVSKSDKNVEKLVARANGEANRSDKSTEESVNSTTAYAQKVDQLVKNGDDSFEGSTCRTFKAMR